MNAPLEREIAGVRPGTTLDLGSGEGGDAPWLAHNGLAVAAVDLSPTALAIGATAQLPGDDITWVATDLPVRQPATTYALVTSCYLHSEVDLARESIFRRTAAAVAPAGILLIFGHSGGPHGSRRHDVGQTHPALELAAPDEAFAALFADSPLEPEHWTVLTNGLVERARRTGYRSPGRRPRPIVDRVLTLRRDEEATGFPFGRRRSGVTAPQLRLHLLAQPKSKTPEILTIGDPTVPLAVHVARAPIAPGASEKSRCAIQLPSVCFSGFLSELE